MYCQPSLKVSIAIPAYKGRFLSHAIRSVLAQTYTNLELIIVNDSSSENLAAIVNSFNDDRIQYYENEVNIGGKDPVANWNKCLTYATGVYFSLLCDDDVYDPTFIEEMIVLKSKFPQVHVFRSRVRIVDENNRIVGLYPSSPEYESCYDYMWHKLSGLRRQTISEFMYDTDYLRACGGYVSLPKAWGSDDISCFTIAKESGIATCNKLLVSFRMSDINISANNDKNVKEKIQAHFIYRDKVKALLLECNDKEIVELINKATDDNLNKQIVWCLMLSNWKDFISMLGNKQISNICFAKALLKKCFRFTNNNR